MDRFIRRLNLGKKQKKINGSTTSQSDITESELSSNISSASESWADDEADSSGGERHFHGGCDGVPFTSTPETPSSQVPNPSPSLWGLVMDVLESQDDATIQRNATETNIAIQKLLKKLS